jgi:hypothetical protein
VARVRTWRCASCQTYVPAADLLTIASKTTGETIALHKLCAATMIQAMKPRMRGYMQKALAGECIHVDSGAAARRRAMKHTTMREGGAA